MSDVTVSVVENTTSVVVSNDVVDINVTESPVTISTAVSGLQGATGPQGASYAQGDPIFVTVRNATGATLPKGTIVYISGSNGNHVQVTPAIATSDATSARTLGWLAASIANNASGLCQVEGYLEGLNTQGFTSGDQLYLSGTTAGAFQVTKPQAPIHLVYVGVVTKVSAGDGHVFVKVQNGYELEELHDVQITSPVNNQVLTYDSATDLWKNATNPADGVTSITATAPLTGGTITSTGSIGLDQTALSITQSQVTSLVTDLANTAKLNTANTFTVGGHVINNSGTAIVPLQINGVSGQSGDLVQVRDNSGNNNVSVSATYGLVGRNAGTVSFALSSASGLGAFYSTAAGNVPMTLRGAASQTADLLQFQTSGGVVRAKVDGNGFAVFGNSTVLSNAVLSVNPFGATQVGAVIRGAASQSANLQEWQDSAGTLITRIAAQGQLGTTARITVGQTTISTAGQLSVVGNTDRVQMAVVGNNPQTANLQEWQNSAGTVRAKVDANGNVFGQVIAGVNSLVFLREENSGGLFEAKKLTAVASNPGSGNAKLYFRDGTTAGTLKLVVRAGAAGAETTILDNIPQ
jgi:hypothetical protein